MNWSTSTAKKEEAPATFDGTFSPSKNLKRTWSEFDRRDATAAAGGGDDGNGSLGTPGTIMFAGAAGWFEGLREAYEGSSQQARLRNEGKDKRLNSGITIARELEYFQSRTVDENSVTFLLNNIPDAPFEAKDARQIQIQAASRYQTYILTTYILEAARREYNKKTGETPPVNLIHATQPERYAVYRDLWSADRENTCRDMWRPVAKSIYWEAIFHPDPKSKACDLQVMKACRNYLKACLIFAMDSAITKRLLVRSGRDADFQGAETYAFNEWKTLHPQKGFPQPPSVLKIPVPPGKGFAKRRRLAEKPGDNEMEGVISDED